MFSNRKGLSIVSGVTESTAGSGTFYPSNLLDKRRGRFLFQSGGLSPVLASGTALRSALLAPELGGSSNLGDALSNYVRLRGTVCTDLSPSAVIVEKDTSLFLKQSRWSLLHTPLNKSDLSLANYMSSLEQSGISFNGPNLPVTDSLEWQTFRNLYLSRISLAEYMSSNSVPVDYPTAVNMGGAGLTLAGRTYNLLQSFELNRQNLFTNSPASTYSLNFIVTSGLPYNSFLSSSSVRGGGSYPAKTPAVTGLKRYL